MKISIIQADLYWENKQANLAMLEEMISEIDNTDMIILPEMFNTGFSMNTTKNAEPMNLHTTKWMKQMAKANDAVITGSICVSDGGQFFNRLLWVRPDGYISFYDKRHLFRMGEEDVSFSSGNSLLIEEWKGWKIAPFICYDLRFPVWSRNKNKAYDLLINVANWPASRAFVWQTLLTARALENQCCVVGVNRVGGDGRDIDYSGDSMIVSAKGEVLHKADNSPCVITHELNLDELQEFRDKFPVDLDGDDFSVVN